MERELNKNFLFYLQNGFLIILKRSFRGLGRIIGNYAVYSIIFSLVLTIICASGALRFRLNENMKTGYIPADSPSRKEFEIYKDFFKNQGTPYYAGIFIEAKDGGSLLRENYFDQIEKLNFLVMEKINVTVEEKNYKFRDLCGFYCGANLPLIHFKTALESRRTKNTTFSGTKLSYPISTISGYKLNVAPYFYGVKSVKNPKNSLPTSISEVKIMVLWFRSDKNYGKTAKILSKWELVLFDYIQSYKNSIIDLIPYGETMINQEILRGGLGVVPYYCLGFLLMMIFMFVTVTISALYHNQMDKKKFLLAISAVISPILAIICTFGSLALVGFHTNIMMLIAPFLVLAVGVDDAFLLIHSWQRLNTHREALTKTIPERLSMVFDEIGPSIMITSLTNSLAFFVGAITSPPEISLFCTCVSLAMALDFLFELIFFAPILCLCCKTPKRQNPDSKADFLQRLLTKSSNFLLLYNKFLISKIGKILALLFWMIYLFIAVQGILKLRPEMEPKDLLPGDSILVKTLDIRRNYIWPEYHPISVIVNQEFNSTDSRECRELNKMITELETLPDSFGPEVTRLWIRDYFEFYESQRTFGVWFDFGLDENADVKDFNLIEEFLKMPQYQHWKEMIHWKKVNDTTVIKSFIFSTAYRNITSLGYRAKLMLQWRAIIDRYPHLNVSLWDPDASFSDVILSVQKITTKTLIITLGSMALVCLLFVPNMASVLVAIVAIASICTGVIGFLSWWGANLDPITMAHMIMAIGFSVDYTAHISYHYYKSLSDYHSKENRLLATLQSVAYPSLQAGLSTMICMGPQAFSPMPSHVTFVKTVFFVSLWGLIHGLFLVPVLLNALPVRWTGAAMFCAKTVEKKEVEMQKL